MGNLDAKRDWGHARDYVEMMWLMLQQKQPEDFVIATGQQYSVREFVTEACQVIDIPITWRGKGTEETGVNPETGNVIVVIDPRYFRPTEVDSLLG
ncbi:MAG: GDP-mannose 4,6-dehydratase, partial [Arenicellales bacterium]